MKPGYREEVGEDLSIILMLVASLSLAACDKKERRTPLADAR